MALAIPLRVFNPLHPIASVFLALAVASLVVIPKGSAVAFAFSVVPPQKKA